MDSIGNRYAIALLGVAREENKVRDYVKVVEQIVDIMVKNPDLGRILKDYGLTSIEKKQTIDLCFKGKIYEYILNLMYVMIDNKRGAFILKAFQEFIRIGYIELNIKHGVIYSTIALSEKEISAMSKKVSEMINSNVTLENKIDSTIVGGFKIQVEDYVIDNSIISRLEGLKKTLTLQKGEDTDGN